MGIFPAQILNRNKIVFNNNSSRLLEQLLCCELTRTLCSNVFFIFKNYKYKLLQEINNTEINFNARGLHLKSKN